MRGPSPQCTHCKDWRDCKNKKGQCEKIFNFAITIFYKFFRPQFISNSLGINKAREMSDNDEVAKASEDLAEETFVIKCTEANTSADEKSLPETDSSDNEDLIILFKGHILDYSDSEKLTNSEASGESTDESDSDETNDEGPRTVEGVKPLVKASNDLDTVIAEWTKELVRQIENDKAQPNPEASMHEENEVLRSVPNELDEGLVIKDEESSSTPDRMISIEAIMLHHESTASPLLRERVKSRNTYNMPNLISLEDDEEYFGDESNLENTMESSASNSLLDESISEGAEESNRSVLFENMETEEINALLEVLIEEHKKETRANKRKFTVSIEGNIGSEKSTFLKNFTEFNNVEVITEPVDKWRNLGGCNLLEKMYENPARWSLVFQSYVQLTMVEQHTSTTERSIKVMERSLYSAMYCFAESLVQSDKMEKSEFEVLAAWFGYLVEEMKNIDLAVDLIIYLRTDPETAMKRVQKRSRGEECLITIEHVKQLHELHEDWLINEKFPRHAPVIVVDANKELNSMVEKYLRTGSYIFNKKEEDEEKLPEGNSLIDFE